MLTIVSLGLKITTFITNILVLIGFALLFSWLQNVKPASDSWVSRYRTLFSFLVTLGIIALFHFTSILNIMQRGGEAGYGWTYLNFQLIAIYFAVQICKKRALVTALAVVVTIWYWWLPRFDYWIPAALVSLASMYLAQHFRQQLSAHNLLFFICGILFAIPYQYANYLSLRGIDIGWTWEFVSLIIIEYAVWEVQHQMQIQRRKQAKLMQEARFDGLTQLHNFRVFNEDLQTAYQRKQESGDDYALYAMDIDHFKHINDTYGHPKGNEVLQAVAKHLIRLTHKVTYQARAYRTGGEEFSLLIFAVDDDFERARDFSLRIQDEIGKLKFRGKKGETFSVTISLGQDHVLDDDQNYLDIYNRADKYLYSSKRSGRNAVTVRGITIKNSAEPQQAQNANE